MNRKILPVKPISQLFPIPMVMGCEGVSAAMMLQYNNQHIPATEIMRHWPTHPNNPHKGYVGHPYSLSLAIIIKRYFQKHMYHFYKNTILIS